MIAGIIAGMIFGCVIAALYADYIDTEEGKAQIKKELSYYEEVDKAKKAYEKKNTMEDEIYTVDVASFRHALKDAEDDEIIVIKKNQIIFPAKPIIPVKEDKQEEVKEVISERLAELLL